MNDQEQFESGDDNQRVMSQEGKDDVDQNDEQSSDLLNLEPAEDASSGAAATQQQSSVVQVLAQDGDDVFGGQENISPLRHPPPQDLAEVNILEDDSGTQEIATDHRQQINTMQERDLLGLEGPSGLDMAIEIGGERDNSLFNDDTSRLTRPSEPQGIDLREQIDVFEHLDGLGPNNRTSIRPVSTMLDLDLKPPKDDPFAIFDAAQNAKPAVSQSSSTLPVVQEQISSSLIDLETPQGEDPNYHGVYDLMMSDRQKKEAPVPVEVDFFEDNGQDLQHHSSVKTSARKSNLSEIDLQMMVSLRQVRTFFLNGDFRKAHGMLTQKLLSGVTESRMLHFFNVCLVYVLLKLKEFNNAKQMATELLQKMEKEGSLSVQRDERIFPVKFLLACSLTELKQSENLEIFYQLLVDQRSQVNKVRQTNGGSARTKKHTGAVDGELWTVWSNVEVETHELFGAFPPKDDVTAKYTMVALEVCRVHTRLQDYRNAYMVIKGCVKLLPNNPFVLSKAGRFCLETGRRAEALRYFNSVNAMLAGTEVKSSSTNPAAGGGAAEPDLVDAILGSSDKKTREGEKVNMLRVLSCFNAAFMDVFEGQFQDACAKFREVQKYKPANVVAANNIATCQIFCNQAGRAIDILTELIKSDKKSNINEQVIMNMMSFYEVYYPATVSDHKNTLLGICSKNGKDAVNAAMEIHNASSGARR